MKAMALVAFGVLGLVGGSRAEGDRSIGLGGDWRMALDREDLGAAERWFARELEGAVKLPGSLAVQGIGDGVGTNTAWTGGINDRSWFEAPEYEKYRQPGNLKIPFWLQPEKVYVGAAWYQRDVEVPEAWKGKRIVLSLERPHWETTVWVDERLAGSRDSLSTPHEYDLSELLPPGKHRLTVRVDNRMVVEVGINAHSVSDHTQGNWNGIVGDIALCATDPIWVEQVQVYPDVAKKSARVEVSVGNRTGACAEGEILLRARAKRDDGGEAIPGAALPVSVRPCGTTVSLEYSLGEGARPWDEFSPNLYRLEVAWKGADGTRDARVVSFGLREVGVEGTQITVNGRKTFLRGTLECCIFPLTGHPPTDVESWKRIIRVCQAHGLNHIRFHSHCPPEAAFVAADEMGFYYQVEVAAWVNQGATIGDGRPIDAWLYEESARIRRAYGNHPSFLLLAYGNEPAGKNHVPWLAEWVKRHRAEDPRQLHTSGAGWPEIPENQFHVTPKPRIQAWGGGLRSRINAKPPETVTDYRDFIASHPQPVISHEIGQWCVYPNFDEIAKYTGHLKAKNFEIFRETLTANGMGDRARDFLMASGKLQALCYKEEIESALRTPGMAGFQLLDLHDFPGQGTALVGVLDPFWDSKGYITPKEFRRFCGPTVPLVRMPKRIFVKGERLEAGVEVAHFGPDALENGVVAWELKGKDDAIVASGSFRAGTIPCGALVPIGEIGIDLKPMEAPGRYRLEVAVGQTHGLSAAEIARNDWDIWVYPDRSEVEEPEGILITRGWDAVARERLESGGKVLLLAAPSMIRGDALGRVKIGFSPIFWNTAWTKRQPPHTLGILCDPRHPALADFPTDFHTNWQWWELVGRSHPFILNDLPKELRPIVQVIDDWVTNRRLGLVFEAKVGKGKLLACGIELPADAKGRPVAGQLRHSLLAYMKAGAFDPTVTLDADQVASLLREPSRMEAAGASILRCDGQADNYPATNLIDGDAETFWHTPWDSRWEKGGGYPHEVVIAFDKPTAIKAVTLTPRQDQASGRAAGFSIYAGNDIEAWGQSVGGGALAPGTRSAQVAVAVPSPVRYLRVVLESPQNPKQHFAALAEIGIE